eukprot:9484717-Pyramimonas_sp.AAC.1
MRAAPSSYSPWRGPIAWPPHSPWPAMSGCEGQAPTHLRPGSRACRAPAGACATAWRPPTLLWPAPTSGWPPAVEDILKQAEHDDCTVEQLSTGAHHSSQCPRLGRTTLPPPSSRCPVVSHQGRPRSPGTPPGRAPACHSTRTGPRPAIL